MSRISQGHRPRSQLQALRAYQGHSDGVDIGIYTPKKSAQINFLWGKITSERLFNSFIPPKKSYTPQNKFLAMPLEPTQLILLTWK